MRVTTFSLLAINPRPTAKPTVKQYSGARANDKEKLTGDGVAKPDFNFNRCLSKPIEIYYVK